MTSIAHSYEYRYRLTLKSGKTYLAEPINSRLFAVPVVRNSRHDLLKLIHIKDVASVELLRTVRAIEPVRVTFKDFEVAYVKTFGPAKTKLQLRNFFNMAKRLGLKK